MSHEITEYDRTIGIEKHWHGLNIIRPDGITIQAAGEDSEMDDILFPVISSPCFLQDDTGAFHAIDGFKTLARRFAGNLRGLSVMGEDYASHVDNRFLGEAVLNGLEREGIKAPISSVGTLRDGKVFFMSLDLEERVNKLGDRFRCHLNITQSHDGTQSPEACDNSVRIVCMNTFRASQSAKGDLKLKVKKTKNASLGIVEMGRVVAAVLAGHDMAQVMFERLAEVDCNLEQAEALFAAWQSIGLDKDGVISTRAFNRVSDLCDLFLKGQGNKGVTLYDAANAVTEYFTHGAGSGGAGVANGKRFLSSEFGTAAGHKTGFVHWLADIADKPSKLKGELATGRKQLKAKRELIGA